MHSNGNSRVICDAGKVGLQDMAELLIVVFPAPSMAISCWDGKQSDSIPKLRVLVDFTNF